MAGNNKTVNDNGKFECGVCGKVYVLKLPFNKHIKKCLIEANHPIENVSSHQQFMKLKDSQFSKILFATVRYGLFSCYAWSGSALSLQ